MTAAEQVATVESDLTAAIAGAVPVTLSYAKVGEPPEPRTISPYEIVTSAEGDESVLGYDHGRQGLRRFRLDRVELVLDASEIADYREPEA